MMIDLDHNAMQVLYEEGYNLTAVHISRRLRRQALAMIHEYDGARLVSLARVLGATAEHVESILYDLVQEEKIYVAEDYYRPCTKG